MGGWVTVLAAAKQHGLAGVVLISAADMAARRTPRAKLVAGMANNMESLAGTSPQQMADELIAHKDSWAFSTAYDGLASTPMLVITSNDGLAPSNDSLVIAVRKLGNARITTAHFPTDHSYSDQRIAMESAVIEWLQKLADRR
jgi:hypothetical protein